MSGIKFPHVVYLLVLMWLVQCAQPFFWFDFGTYGILPRTTSGLPGIILAPWIHHGWWHLIGNSVPFLVLGILMQLKSHQIFWPATLMITVLAGLGTWAFGSSAYHVGASGLVLGYWSFLVADACFRRSLKSILIAIVSLALYGGFVFVLLDVRPNISWSGHASGLLAGVIVAKLFCNSRPREVSSHNA